MKPSGFPKGWDERRVSKLLDHYETQSEEESVAEDEALWLDPEQTVKEIDANYEAFQEALPDLLPHETDRWALMRRGECVDFYDTLRDAETAGRAMYKDRIFSVQQVSDTVVDLGWFSHAVY